MKKGDGWWEQFLTAFAWQHQVEKYGVDVYEDVSGSVRIMAPISVEHVQSLVQVLVTREVNRRREEGVGLGEDEAQSLIDKITSETILRLTSMDKILTLEVEVEIIPDSERTRALTDLLGGSGAAETPYTRTLLFAYEWAGAELARQLGVFGVQSSAGSFWRPESRSTAAGATIHASVRAKRAETLYVPRHEYHARRSLSASGAGGSFVNGPSQLLHGRRANESSRLVIVCASSEAGVLLAGDIVAIDQHSWRSGDA